MKSITVDQIDLILPQTQCGLCDHAGCKPYAEAIVNGRDQIDRCPPGGVNVLKRLGQITGIDPTSYIPEMLQKAKPTQKIIIREDECIGCTKCIQACPVDAILGASKLMHTVIADECTGCELCIEPCPMDCIDIVSSETLDDDTQLTFSNQSRKRYQFREARLDRIKQEKQSKHNNAKMSPNKNKDVLAARRNAINAAVARSKMKKDNNT